METLLHITNTGRYSVQSTSSVGSINMQIIDRMAGILLKGKRLDLVLEAGEYKVILTPPFNAEQGYTFQGDIELLKR